MRLIYIGQDSGTSLDRFRALQRLGYVARLVNPWDWLPKSRWTGRWIYYAGGIGFNSLVSNRLVNEVQHFAPQVVWVDQGEWLGPSLLRKLRFACQINPYLINYTVDDPFGPRDRLRFMAFRRSVPEYDLLAVVREENVGEAFLAGARRVVRVWRSADEVSHSPRVLSCVERERFGSEVVFVGGWRRERGALLAELVRRGVPISLFGDAWERGVEWPTLAPFWRGPSVYGEEYKAAILGAKVCLGFLCKENRDLHTTRSLEIPALGGLFCAERTSEHLELYEDGHEAVFWRNAAECAEQCMALLADPLRRTAIAEAGRARAVRNGHYNEKVLARVLDAAMGECSRPAQGIRE